LVSAASVTGVRVSGKPCFHSITGEEKYWRASRFRKVVTATERAAQQQEGLMPAEGFWDSRGDIA
jgi:hypothetical protein